MDDVKITPEIFASTNARKRQQRNHQHRKQSGRYPPTVFSRALVKRCSIGVAFTHELFHAVEDDSAPLVPIPPSAAETPAHSEYVSMAG